MLRICQFKPATDSQYNFQIERVRENRHVLIEHEKINSLSHHAILLQFDHPDIIMMLCAFLNLLDQISSYINLSLLLSTFLHKRKNTVDSFSITRAPHILVYMCVETTIT